jgi:hypothetical protein
MEFSEAERMRVKVARGAYNFRQRLKERPSHREVTLTDWERAEVEREMKTYHDIILKDTGKAPPEEELAEVLASQCESMAGEEQRRAREAWFHKRFPQYQLARKWAEREIAETIAHRKERGLQPLTGQEIAESRAFHTEFMLNVCVYCYCRVCNVDTREIGEYNSLTEWACFINGFNPQGRDGMHCIGCLEKKIGRRLVREDFMFPGDELRVPSDASARLLDRLGSAA